MTQTMQELEDEVARLRSRVLELELKEGRHNLKADTSEREHDHEHDRGRSSRSHRRRISNRAADEGGGLFRAFALAGVEAIRATGSVMSSFADTVTQRNRIEEKDSRDDLTRDLPNDVYTGARNALDHVLDIPDRVLDQLHGGYREYKDSGDTRQSRDEGRSTGTRTPHGDVS
ncbi:MAG TPA: hypothetical protein VEO54_11935 [Thermoanaerobaculia bacterium]|nr:hypothetical protein [Thermoanaerobaculia bacterium]